jgi:DNA segregation ATPase FtsK/SpoIIIE-like protein
VDASFGEEKQWAATNTEKNAALEQIEANTEENEAAKQIAANSEENEATELALTVAWYVYNNLPFFMHFFSVYRWLIIFFVFGLALGKLKEKERKGQERKN